MQGELRDRDRRFFFLATALSGAVYLHFLSNDLAGNNQLSGSRQRVKSENSFQFASQAHAQRPKFLGVLGWQLGRWVLVVVMVGTLRHLP